MALFLSRRSQSIAIEPLLPLPQVGDRVVIERCGCPPSAFTTEPHNGEMGTVVRVVADTAVVDWGGTRPCVARVRPLHELAKAA
jgi:hypothetical protein